MSRLIDADAIAYESIDSCDTGRHEHYFGTGIIAVRKEDIDAMPTIQPKRGRWIHHPEWEDDGECGYECSECHMGSDVDYNFCMRCGADMREVTT